MIHLTEHRMPVSMPRDLLAQLDQWRAWQVDLPSRAEAVRRLIAAGTATNRPVLYPRTAGDAAMLPGHSGD